MNAKRTPGLFYTLRGKIWSFLALSFFLGFVICFFIFGSTVESSSPADLKPQELVLFSLGVAFFVLFLASLIVLLVLFARTKKAQKNEEPFRVEVLTENTTDDEKFASWEEERSKEKSVAGAAFSSEIPSYSYYFYFMLFSYGHIYFLWSFLSIYIIVWSVFALLGGDLAFPILMLIFAIVLLLLSMYGAFLFPWMLQRNGKRMIISEVQCHEDRLISFQCQKKDGVYQQTRVSLPYDDVIDYRYVKGALYLRSKWNKKPLALSLPLQNASEDALRLLEERFPKKKRQ